MKRTITSKRQLGQGMTEYIIIVALIAISAIGVYNFFGKTVRQEVAGIALGLSGNEGAATTEVGNAQTTATSAQTDADKAKGMQNFEIDTKNQ